MKNLRQKEQLQMMIVASLLVFSTIAMVALKLELKEEDDGEKVESEDGDPPSDSYTYDELLDEGSEMYKYSTLYLLTSLAKEDKKLIDKIQEDVKKKKEEELRLAREYAKIAEERYLAAEAEEKRLAEIARQEQLERERRERLAAEKSRKEETRKKEQQVVVSRGSEYKGSWRSFQATYYTSGCYKCSGIGASGVDLRHSIYYEGMRVIAADPRVLPLWSIVEIQSGNHTYKAIVLDTGGKIKNQLVDVLVETKDEAYRNGRHSIQLRVLRKGK